MDPRVFPLAEIFRLDGWLLHNCLDDLTEEQALARPAPGVNSAAFIAAHLADSRHAIAGWLGSSLPNPLASYLADARSIEDVRELPPLEALLAAWDRVDAELARRLRDATPAALDGPAPGTFPTGGGTMLGALAFLAHHDSYHVGQLALIRRHLGLPAMRYVPRGEGAAD